MRQVVCISREPGGLVAQVLSEAEAEPALTRVPLQELRERDIPRGGRCPTDWSARQVAVAVRRIRFVCPRTA